MGLPDGEEIMTLAFFVLTQYRLVKDRRTDRHVAIAITRASIASRGRAGKDRIGPPVSQCMFGSSGSYGRSDSGFRWSLTV